MGMGQARNGFVCLARAVYVPHVSALYVQSGIPREELYLASKVWGDVIYEGGAAVKKQVSFGACVPCAARPFGGRPFPLLAVMRDHGAADHRSKQSGWWELLHCGASVAWPGAQSGMHQNSKDLRDGPRSG